MVLQMNHLEAKDKTYTIHPETVAEQFWYLHQHKQETVSLCGEPFKLLKLFFMREEA